MKILLASPGTGKTTKTKSIVQAGYSEADNILVLSFTNATINDLKSSLKDFDNVSCYTLHSYALKINHLPSLHVLNDFSETTIIQKIAGKLKIDFDDFCSFLQCITFSKMIEKCISFIKANPQYVSDNIGKLDLLMVDEFQDFNEIERQLIYLLSKYASETIILGDDDQSIYDFKDADPDGIIALYKDAGIEKIDHENVCYRCPDVIVEYCSRLIGRNQRRVNKDWHKSNKAGNVIFEQKLTQAQTCDYVCSEIKKVEEGNSILVLSPVRFYIPELKKKLDQNGIPNIDFWTTKISPDLCEKIWWLKALYSDHKIIFLLLLGKVLNLFSKRGFIEILTAAFRKAYDDEGLIRQIIHFYPKPFSDYVVSPIVISEFWKIHQQFLPLKKYVKEDELISSVNNLERSLNPTLSFDKDVVNIMSIHKSKGLQADCVFIIGLNEGIIPNAIRGVDTIEAQRRLLFVGMTRALRRLYMISTVEWEGKFVHKVDKNQFRYKYLKKLYHGKTSHFIEEINH